MTERENIKRKQKKNHSLKKCSLVSVCFDKIPQKNRPAIAVKKQSYTAFFIVSDQWTGRTGTPLRKKPLQT